MNFWETLSVIAVGVCAIVPILFTASKHGRATGIAIAAAVITATACLAFVPQPDEDDLPLLIPRQTGRGNFATSKSCRSCHPGSYESWHRTYHRTMTQLATSEVVLAPFDNLTLQSKDDTYFLERRGDEFWVTMPDSAPPGTTPFVGGGTGALAGIPTVSRRVVLTTGSHHMQIYWYTAGNYLHELGFYYHIASKRWIPKRDSVLMPPDGHQPVSAWNMHCIRCHSVAGNTGMDPRTGTPFSEVAEFGIACEACHGPAEEHIRFHRNPVKRYGLHLKKSADPTIVHPGRLSAKASSQVCGRCHSTFLEVDPIDAAMNGIPFRPGDDLAKSCRMLRFDTKPEGGTDPKTYYWRDGTCRVGGDEYLGLIESPCYQRGEMSCLSCHSMHSSDPNDQLEKRMDGNHACLQCHQSMRDNIAKHTHHPAKSAGSLCYNCHMPNTSYALFTAMRSHRIDSPNVATTVETDRPNACNLCHVDQTLAWTADHLSNWYGQPAVELSNDQQSKSAVLIWLLTGDAVQRIIATWHLGWESAREASGDDWQAPFLAQLLEDPYSAVRYVTYLSLRQIPGFEDFEFDYIGSATSHSQARERALGIWRAKRGSTESKDRERILIGPTGDVIRDELDRLLKERDDADVVISE